jgi:hypothetical protein
MAETRNVNRLRVASRSALHFSPESLSKHFYEYFSIIFRVFTHSCRPKSVNTAWFMGNFNALMKVVNVNFISHLQINHLSAFAPLRLAREWNYQWKLHDAFCCYHRDEFYHSFPWWCGLMNHNENVFLLSRYVCLCSWISEVMKWKILLMIWRSWSEERDVQGCDLFNPNRSQQWSENVTAKCKILSH